MVLYAKTFKPLGPSIDKTMSDTWFAVLQSQTMYLRGAEKCLAKVRGYLNRLSMTKEKMLKQKKPLQPWSGFLPKITFYLIAMCVGVLHLQLFTDLIRHF